MLCCITIVLTIQRGFTAKYPKTNKVDELLVIPFGPLIMKTVSPLDPCSLQAKRNPAWNIAGSSVSSVLFGAALAHNNVPSNLWYKVNQIPKLKCLLSHFAVVFAQSI